jgi:alkylhydroperoxidase family enzyme
MGERDVAALRDAGFDDVAIHDAIQVIAYFNYINRIADAIHVDLEPGMPAYPGEP